MNEFDSGRLATAKGARTAEMSMRESIVGFEASHSPRETRTSPLGGVSSANGQNRPLFCAQLYTLAGQTRARPTRRPVPRALPAPRVRAHLQIVFINLMFVVNLPIIAT